MFATPYHSSRQRAESGYSAFYSRRSGARSPVAIMKACKVLLLVAVSATFTATAHAQVDHVREDATAPACVTPFHLDEAEALIRARRPVNPDVCFILKGGTEVVRVREVGGYQQVAYQLNGQTFSLFMNDHLLTEKWIERKAFWEQEKKREAEQAAKAKEEREAQYAKEAMITEQVGSLEAQYNRCHYTYTPGPGEMHPVCQRILNLIKQKEAEIAKIYHP